MSKTEPIVFNFDNEDKYKVSHEIPYDINQICYESIIKFYKNTEHDVDDYISLHTGGKDRYSYMYKDELEKYIEKDVCEYIRYHLTNKEQRFYEYALRWYLRGLSASDAYKKINCDY